MRIVIPLAHALAVARETGEDPRDVLLRYEEHGAEAVDVTAEYLKENGAPALLSLLSGTGLSCAAVDAVLNLASPEAEKEIPALLRLASDVGAKTVSLVPGLRLSVFGQDVGKRIDDACERFAALSREKGIAPALRNLAHEASGTATASELSARLRAAPALSLAFDARELFFRDENTVVVFREMKAHVSRVLLGDTLCDDREYGEIPLFRAGERSYFAAPLGEGNMPMKTWRHTVREEGFDGDVVLLAYNAADVDAVLIKSLDFMRA